MTYLIIKANKPLDKEEVILLKDALNEAIKIIKFDTFDNYYFVKIENVDEINLLDLFTTINAELYLPITVFESKSLIDCNYFSWALKAFMNYNNSSMSLVTEKDLLRAQINYDNENIKRNVLKIYYNDKDIINMLKVFFECNLNTSKAADLLYMHRNTLINKLDKFYEVTGYDVRRFMDASLISALINV